ncbi:MAG: NAD(P)H-hydrate dehydratase [Acidimicrobiales bacterium]|nr:NAD(P)H-hydrate dehydratase [Acidimicrobiales bacterium]
MIPILTPAQMAAVDAVAADRMDDLIDRAGRAVALAALDMLGGTYGRRVTVLVGPGNNGADGRAAAAHLRRRGVRVEMVDALAPGDRALLADLVIDAAFGNGLSRPYTPPPIDPASPVLAVDLPSGVNGLTGERLGDPWPADRTVTFVALKPGLVLEPGRSLGGDVQVVDIGLDAGAVSSCAVDDGDVAALLPRRPVDDHKWRAAVRVIGGAPGMTGAASLAARAAVRLGAGIVQLALPGGRGDEGPTEVVGHPLPATNWSAEATDGLERIGCVLVGPGLGPASLDDLLAVAATDAALVVDGDALQPELLAALSARSAPTVLTPHDGEWARLGGSTDPDRLAATSAFAIAHGVTVVRKGPTSVVAGPKGISRVVTSGTAALASAGTGDVLAGAIAALLARGLDGRDAGVVAAHLHGRAGTELGVGLLASEVADRLPDVAHRLR